jgi:hypothetical protein
MNLMACYYLMIHKFEDAEEDEGLDHGQAGLHPRSSHADPGVFTSHAQFFGPSLPLQPTSLFSFLMPA